MVAMLEHRNIAISISESPDMAALGYSEQHLKDAMAGFAIYLLASGASLAYGGDLRGEGFTRLMFDLVLRYRPRDCSDPRATNYLPWPIHATMTKQDLEAVDEELQGFGRLVLAGLDGEPVTLEQRDALPRPQVDEAKSVVGLTAMRKLMRRQTDARIVLGGRVVDYKGKMPGVAEEALLSLEADQPLFLVGTYGGCARDICETIGVAKPRNNTLRSWPCRGRFEKYTGDALNNGLNLAENGLLATTPDIDQAITLVLTGLNRLCRKPAAQPTSQESPTQPPS